MNDMTHPLAAIHSRMPASLRDSSPLATWPEDAEWDAQKHTADSHGPWCQVDRHAGQKIPGAWSENVAHSAPDFHDLYAFWNTCAECHDELVVAQTTHGA